MMSGVGDHKGAPPVELLRADKIYAVFGKIEAFGIGMRTIVTYVGAIHIKLDIYNGGIEAIGMGSIKMWGFPATTTYLPRETAPTHSALFVLRQDSRAMGARWAS